MDVEKYIADPRVEVSFKPVKISEQALDVILKHSLEDYPHECCGFLFGAEEKVRFIYQAKPVLNSAEENQKTRFEITPKDYLMAERYSEEHGLTLLGVYHSHPDHPAIPSIHDFRQAVPFFSYIIVSVLNGRVDALRSWQINEDGFFEEENIITQSQENKK